MSSRPGYSLEEYVQWLHDIVVLDRPGDDPNPSLRIAEALGYREPRPRLTADQFALVLALYEPHREYIEHQLHEYDEDESGSWRDYAGCAFDNVPRSVWEQAFQVLKALENE